MSDHPDRGNSSRIHEAHNATRIFNPNEIYTQDEINSIVAGIFAEIGNPSESIAPNSNGASSGYDTAGVSNGVLASKSGAVAARSVGFGKDAALIADFRNDQPLKRHTDYRAAKGGDIAAAVRLVQDMVKPSSIEAAKAFGDDVIYVPVHAEEASGRNKIPNALTLHYAAETGGEVDDSIVQSNRAFHTGANAMERLLARAGFSGNVEAGRRYVLVPTHKVPLVGRFYGDLENQSSQGNRYYSNLKEINLIEMELNGRREDRLPTDGFRKENPKEQLIGRAKRADNS